MTSAHHPRVRGAATLIVVMSLLMATLVAAAYASRGIVFEQRASIEQYRATQAFEAAEAGLEWALVQLNRGRLDERCNPSDAAADATVRERGLILDEATGAFNTRSDAGMPACVSGSDGRWHCGCPAHGGATPEADTIQRAFRVTLTGARSPDATTSYPGIVQVTVQGCTARPTPAAATVCVPTPMDGQAYAVSTVQAALLPALAVVPAATLTAQGKVEVGADVVIANDQGDGFLAVDVGQSLTAPPQAVTGAGGAPTGQAVVDHDDALAARSATTVFTALFGVTSSVFPTLPAVTTLDCEGDCSAAVQQAISQGARMLWLTHDVTLRDVSIGTAAKPVVIATPGHLLLQGKVELTGAVYAASLQWAAAASPESQLRGAALVTGDVSLQGGLALHYDRAALRKLQLDAGSFVRVPGSWTDS